MDQTRSHCVLILLLLWFAIVCLVFSFFDWYLLVLGYSELGMSELLSALGLSYLVLAITQMFAGILIDVVGESRVLLLSSILFTLSCLAFTLRNVKLALVLYMLVCELNIAINVLLTKISPSRIGFNVSLFETAEQVISVCGPLLLAATLEFLGFWVLSMLCLLLSLVCLVLSLALLRIRSLARVGVGRAELRSRFTSIVKCLRKSNLRMLTRYVTVLTVLAVYTRVVSVFIPIAAYETVRSELTLGAYYSAAALLSVPAIPAIGRLVDKISLRHGTTLAALLAFPPYIIVHVVYTLRDMYIASLLIVTAILCIICSESILIACRWRVITNAVAEDARGTVAGLVRVLSTTAVGIVLASLGLQH